VAGCFEDALAVLQFLKAIMAFAKLEIVKESD